MTNVLRVYEPHELGSDGYPHEWHGCCGDLEHDPAGGIKHRVRAQAGHRCVRCGHPYTPGCGEWDEHWPTVREPVFGEFAQLAIVDHPPDRPVREAFEKGTLWTPCDEHCTHRGPVRWARDWEGPGIRQGWCEGDLLVPVGTHLRRAVRGLEPGETYRVQASWRILTVHHLNERKFDCRWWNLAALCQRCHLRMQRNVTMDVPYPWEHTPWFRPYVAGFYAYKYAGLDLSRPEVEARMDEFLALGQREESVERMPL